MSKLKSNADNAKWVKAANPITLLFPVSLALTVGATAGYCGSLNVTTLLLLTATAVFVQLVNNFAREYGLLDESERKRREFYDKRFAQMRKVGKRVDPGAMTAGNLEANQLRSVMFTSMAISLILGYCLVFYSFESLSWTIRLYAFVFFTVLVVLVALRYVGSWRYGFAVYGDFVTFLIVAIGGVFGGYLLFIQKVVYGVFFPAIGFGALAVAIANLREICDMTVGTRLEHRTLPMVFGAEHAATLQVVFAIVALLWYAAFMPLMGSGLTWKLAFLVFFLPVIRDSIAFKRSGTPENAPDFLKSLFIAVLLLSLAFFVCAGSNSFGLLYFMAQ